MKDSGGGMNLQKCREMSDFEINTEMTRTCEYDSWIMTYTPSNTEITIEDSDQQELASSAILKLLKMVKHSDLNTEQLKELSNRAAKDYCRLSMPVESFDSFEEMFKAITK